MSTGATILGLALQDGDLALANGALAILDNPRAVLLQGLVARVLTPLGSDVFNTTYGLDVSQAFTQTVTRSTFRQLIQLNLVRTLGTDPRVREIRQVLFQEDPVGRLGKVSVVIETVDSQTQTLTLDLGVLNG